MRSENSFKVMTYLFAFITLLLTLVDSVELKAQDKFINDLAESQFLNPPDESKPWAFFWWFNGYTDKRAITKHLEELKEKGIGGIVLYASEAGDIPKGAAFMSPEWRNLFRFAVEEASRLGLEMGVNICNGWPAGGPWISAANNSWIVISSSQIVKGGQKFAGKLAEPNGKNDLYADVSVQAIQISEAPGFQVPKITASSNMENVVNLQDGSYVSRWVGKSVDGKNISAENPQWIRFEYEQPEAIDYVWIGNFAFSSPALTEFQYSDDGVHFKTIKEFRSHYLNMIYGEVPRTYSRYFRTVFNAGGAWRDHVDIGEVYIGTKPHVKRIMKLAAMQTKNNPMGVRDVPYKTQLDFIQDTLVAFTGENILQQNSILDITKYCSPDGVLSWNIPPGLWKIVRIGCTNTRADAGNGLMTDYLSAEASDQHFEKFMKLLIEDAGSLAGKTLKYFHEDNAEIHEPYTWTPAYIKEFKSLRGYDPVPYLPVLAGEQVGSLEITTRFLQDYRRTIADLTAVNHYERLQKEAKKYGMGMESEAGGPYLPFMPAHDALMNLGRMDIPLAEFWESSHWKENQFNQSLKSGKELQNWMEGAQNVNAKQASSAGHIYGKRVIAAESFTSLGPNAHWGSTPADLLLYSNIAFCEGINRLILHSSTTTREEDGMPGYEYGAGTHFNQNVTWWKDAAPFFKFLARCENMLQRGLFVADVLYYNGDDVPNIVQAKHIPADLGYGYDYDVCNTEVLLKRLSVRDGLLVLPDGMSYRLMVLPDTKNFTPETLIKIKQLVFEGAKMIGPKPGKAMGLRDYPESDQQIKNLANQLWGDTNGKTITENKFGKGIIYWGKTAREVLEISHIVPDFSYMASDKNALIDFIHRREGNMDIYYVANRRNSNVLTECTFRIQGRQPELWNPFTGQNQKALAFSQKNGTISLPIELAPYGSTFVVFRNAVSESLKGVESENYPQVVFTQVIEGAFEVTFKSAFEKPESVVFEKLEDWSIRPEDFIRYFSGTAKYSKNFRLSGVSTLQSGKRVILDLGDVKNTAHVWLNGKDLGVLWAPPFRVDISDCVQINNSLVIEVTNTWVNRLTGDSRLPPPERKTKTNIVFSPETKLRLSGLLGPVRLLEQDTVRVKNFNEVPDEAHFFSTLDLEMPQLLSVRNAVKKGDWLAAKREWAKYLQNRNKPRWIWSREEKLKIRNAFDNNPEGIEFYDNLAEKTLAREFTFNGVTKMLPKQFNWVTGSPIWEQLLNRHVWLQTLAKAYVLTGKAAYAQDFNELIKDWVKNHPVPPDVNKSWNGSDKAWMTLEAGIRTGYWMDILEAFFDAPEFDCEALYLMTRSIVEHARYLASREDMYRAGNWQVAECTGLACAGIMFPEFKESVVWREKSFRYLSEHMDKDVLPDGTHIEVTPGYHITVMTEFLKVSLLSKTNGYTIPGLMDKHEKMFDFILDIAKPDVIFPGLGDAVPESAKSVLGLGALIYKRGDMRWLGALKAQPEWVWLLGAGVIDKYGELKSVPPVLRSVLLPDSKYAVMRTGWQKDDKYLLFDCAPSLGSHSHGDRLQVLVYAGRDLLIDPGQYSYAEPLMEYFRSTKPHNVLVIDGKDQEWINPKITSWHVGKEIEYVSGKMDLKELSHQRTVVFIKPDYWVITDHLEAKDEHEYTRQFQFPIGSNAVIKGITALTQFFEGTNLSVISVEDTRPEMRTAPIPTSQTTTNDAPQAVFVNRGKSLTLSTVLIPFSETKSLPKIERQENDKNIPGESVIQITFPNGRIDKIAIADKESNLKIGSFSRKVPVLCVTKNKKGEERMLE